MDDQGAAEALIEIAELAIDVDVDSPGIEARSLNWWFDPDFRRRPTAAVDCGNGALQLPVEARERYENVATWLISDRGTAHAWEPRDLWATLMSFICALKRCSGEDRAALAHSGLQRLLNAETSMVLQAVANARWTGPPTHFGGWLVSRVGDERFPTLLMRSGLDRDAIERIQELLASAAWPEDQVVVARVGVEHQSRALKRCDSMLRDFVATCLLLADPDVAGDAARPNRVYEPGRWGLELDRNHFTTVEGQEHTHHYGSTTIEVSKFGIHASHRWHGDEPVDLYAVASTCNPHLLERVLWGADEFAQRIRLAARWFGKSFWYAEAEDATLALGVALDIMLTGGKDMSTEAKRHVFAMLEPEPTLRRDARRNFSRFYSLRSAAAHGGDSASVRNPENIEWQRAQLRWLVQQLSLFVQLDQTEAASGALSRALDDLRYGVVAWQPTEQG